MIVGRMLDVFAIAADLILERPVEPAPSERAPFWMIEKKSGGVKRGGFGDEMIVVLRPRIDERWRDSIRMSIDTLDESPASFRI